MKLESQVCSIEYSKRLCELGVKQESLFYYEYITLTEEWHITWENNSSDSNYSAFTVAELGEMLPYAIFDYEDTSSIWLTCFKDKEEFTISYDEIMTGEHTQYFFEQKDKTEANARAKMLIHLLENGLMELPK